MHHNNEPPSFHQSEFYCLTLLWITVSFSLAALYLNLPFLRFFPKCEIICFLGELLTDLLHEQYWQKHEGFSPHTTVLFYLLPP